MDPPKFNGEVDPIAALHWLSELKKIFEMLEIDDNKIRISLASFQLVGEASEWWSTLVNGQHDAMRVLGGANPQGVIDSLAGMSWMDFEASFESQYFPELFRDKLRGQCERLEQWSMSVNQYATKFQSLSRFAHDSVNSEEKKRKRFEQGLHPSI